MPVDYPDPLDPGGAPPGAAWLNQLVAAAMANRISVDGSSGLVSSSGSGGTALAIHRTPLVAIKLTYQSGSSYSWIEQIAAAGGGWTAGTRKGYATGDPAKGSVPADPAWEANGNSHVPIGYIVEDASRDAAVGRLTFRAGTC
jgi:hypothetical protein